MRRPLLSALVQLLLAGFVGVTAVAAQSISVLYREPADAFELCGVAGRDVCEGGLAEPPLTVASLM